MRASMFVFACLILPAAACAVGDIDETEAIDEAEAVAEAESPIVMPCMESNIAPCPTCGDGYCGLDEDLYCPEDCGPYCGDGVCSSGETSSSCSTDCCTAPSPFITRSSGVADGYSTANGTESPSPSSGLQAFVAANYYYSEIRKYDDDRYDRFFAHTFSGLKPSCGTVPICSGTLTIRLRNQHYNDAMMVGFVSSAGALLPGYWFRWLSDLGVGVGSDQTLVLNLAALPTASGTTNLLSQIASKGYLDVYVQDDSPVDYMTLNLGYCSGPVP